MSAFTPPSAGARETARTASLLGLVSVALVLLGPCGGCTPMIFALPLALIALSYARAAQADGGSDEVVEVQVRHATATSLMAAAYSTVILSLVVGYLMLYAGMVALVIATS